MPGEEESYPGVTMVTRLPVPARREQILGVALDVDVDQRGDRSGRRRRDPTHRRGELVISAASAADEQTERGMVLGQPAEVPLKPASARDLPSVTVPVACLAEGRAGSSTNGEDFDPDEVAGDVSGLAWAGLRAVHRPR